MYGRRGLKCKLELFAGGEDEQHDLKVTCSFGLRKSVS